MLQKPLIEIALCEGLDEFVGIADCDEKKVEYYTVHGWRNLSHARPELNQFFVLKTGAGFARAIAMPYVRSLNIVNQIPQLIVEWIVSDAATAGYAKAVKLPYYTAGGVDAFPIGTLVVCINENNLEALSAGYANALLVLSKGVSYRRRDICEVYIEDLQMLDTEYAAPLLAF